MKNAFTLFLLSSAAIISSANAQTNITSSNPLEDTFVRVMQIGGDSTNPLIHFEACRGTPSNFTDCAQLGKRQAYLISDLRSQRNHLREEEAGVGLLDVGIVVGSIAAGAAVGTAAAAGALSVAATEAGGTVLAALSLGSASILPTSTIVVSSAVGTAGVAGTGAIIADVKKLNPLLEKREADTLNQIMSGNGHVVSMNDFIISLGKALNF